MHCCDYAYVGVRLLVLVVSPAPSCSKGLEGDDGRAGEAVGHQQPAQVGPEYSDVGDLDALRTGDAGLSGASVGLTVHYCFNHGDELSSLIMIPVPVEEWMTIRRLAFLIFRTHHHYSHPLDFHLQQQQQQQQQGGGGSTLSFSETIPSGPGRSSPWTNPLDSSQLAFLKTMDHKGLSRNPFLDT